MLGLLVQVMFVGEGLSNNTHALQVAHCGGWHEPIDARDLAHPIRIQRDDHSDRRICVDTVLIPHNCPDLKCIMDTAQYHTDGRLTRRL